MKNKGTSKKKNMADLLFADLRRPRRPRQFKPAINIENFTDEELRNRFRFGRRGKMQTEGKLKKKTRGSSPGQMKTWVGTRTSNFFSKNFKLTPKCVS